MEHYTTAASLGVQEDTPVPHHAPLPHAPVPQAAHIGAWEPVAPREVPAHPSVPAAAPVPEWQEEKQAARTFALVERSLDEEEPDLVPIVTKRQRRTEALPLAHSDSTTEDKDTGSLPDAPTSSLFRKRKARRPPC